MNFDKPNRIEEEQILESSIKEGVDFVYEQHLELNEIGTEEEYSSYLDTIFPDSKVKDILYHGDSQEGEKEEFYEKTGKIGSRNTVIFFAMDRNWARSWAEKKDKNITSVLVNIKNQFNFSDLSEEDKSELVELNRKNIIQKGLSEDFARENSISILRDLEEGWWEVFNEPYLADFFNKKGYDSWKEKEGEGYENLTVFSPKQIHILGSKADINKFKKFIEGDKNN